MKRFIFILFIAIPFGANAQQIDSVKVLPETCNYIDVVVSIYYNVLTRFCDYKYEIRQDTIDLSAVYNPSIMLSETVRHDTLFILIPSNGNYKLLTTMYTNYLSCSYDSIVDTSQLNITLNNIDTTCISGIKEPTQTLALSPNPTNSQITLTAKREGSINLYNMQGQEVMKANVSRGRNTISVALLPKGIYVVQLSTRDGLHRQKLVKN